MTPDTASRAQALDLIDFIDAAPSPWHAADAAARRLAAQGYRRLEETDRWQLAPGGRYFVLRGGSSLIAFVVGREPLAETGLRVVGAHLDSPGLRLKPRAAYANEGLVSLGVEVYGSPILATYADRDLSLAGRVSVRGAAGPEERLCRFEAPLVRLPNLAIHMNREVNEKGLKLDKQTELPLILAAIREGVAADERFAALLAERLQVAAGDLLAWELCAYDTQKGSLWGPEEEFVAGGRLDNLASCHAALAALLAAEEPPATCLGALFDHEEVGSGSAAGAGGSFIADVIARIAAGAGLDGEDRHRALARSFFVSADMAHAWQPNFPAAYEPRHRLLVNGGPAVKINANQRYSTGADTTARFIALCERADVPHQLYAHRTDLACGSTIGPLVAARLGIASVDVGSPLWAMHSIRESCGALDHAYLIAALTALLRG